MRRVRLDGWGKLLGATGAIGDEATYLAGVAFTRWLPHCSQSTSRGPCEVTVVNEVIRERPLEAAEAVSSGCAT